jgi:site-specific DNA-methyltransferase (cytosine-N4-specific)
VELNRCYLGDCRDVMRDLIARDVRVQCIVTSPPYFGLRDYGVDGQLGLEPTPEEYVGALVNVFRVARDLLADDGTLWLNIGDSYCSRPNGTVGKESRLQGAFTGHTEFRRAHALRKPGVPSGLKHKDLIGVPWMLAFALRADGWYLRQEIIWHKPNPMPESVRDRCTKAHEHLFLLTKSERYAFDASAISEEASGELPGNRSALKGTAQDPEKHRTRAGLHAYAERQRSRRYSFARQTKESAAVHGQTAQHRPDREDVDYAGRRNKRSVWTVATKPYAGAHFAVMPETLVEPCILAGSRPGDIVFDPFMGSGTVAAVAQRLGRRWLGAELNPQYIELQAQRTRQAGLQLEHAT